MGGTVALGFTSTNHDHTRLPPLSPMPISHEHKKTGPRVRVGAVGRPIGRPDMRDVSATPRVGRSLGRARAYAFVTHKNTRPTPR
jgi:hypothetical protein